MTGPGGHVESWDGLVRVEIEWRSAGTVAQDEALLDKIATFVHKLLEDYDPSVSGTLRSHTGRR
jgi:hypothetical protein